MEARLKNMTDAIVPSIEALRVDAVELPHPPGQIGLRRLEQQVVMVHHLAVGKHEPSEALSRAREHLEPLNAVDFVSIDRLASVAAGRHMVNRVGRIEPKRPGHAGEARANSPIPRPNVALLAQMSYCKT